MLLLLFLVDLPSNRPFQSTLMLLVKLCRAKVSNDDFVASMSQICAVGKTYHHNDRSIFGPFLCTAHNSSMHSPAFLKTIRSLASKSNHSSLFLLAEAFETFFRIYRFKLSQSRSSSHSLSLCLANMGLSSPIQSHSISPSSSSSSPNSSLL